MSSFTLAIVLGLVALAVCQIPPPPANPVAAEVYAAMNWSVDPCQDFYSFSCGGWLAANQIPPDRSKLDRAFTGIEIMNRKVLLDIVSDPNTSSTLRNFYTSCMDLNSIAAQGLDPIQPLMDVVDEGLDDITSLMVALQNLQAAGVEPFFGMGVSIDPGNPTKNVLSIGQGGLALPDASFYTDSENAGLIQQYLTHITKMFTLAGFSDAVEQANNALFIEQALANITVPPADLTDPFATYNPYTLITLEGLAPAFDWETYFDFSAFTSPSVIATNVSVDVPDFFSGLSNLFINVLDVDQIGSYMRWNILHAFAPYLTQDLVNENFAFFGTVISGLKQPTLRNYTCLNVADAELGQLLGKYFAQKAFSGDKKTAVQNMILQIETAMQNNLNNLPWMDNVTRQRALQKLSLIINLVGYPDNPDFFPGDLAPTLYVANIFETRGYAFSQSVQTIGGPSDRYQWEMSPSTVNAYYDPTRNEMVFPAAIIQTPYYNSSFPDAMNYGGIGMIAGHELTHGFDNQGRDFDGTGRLTNWWEDATAQEFVKRVQCVIDQYNKFEILPGLFVNGRLTQGENIADMGGIKNAYFAYVNNFGSVVNQPSFIPQLTNGQLFFVGFAQGWCSKATPEAIRNRILTDPHSPPKFRVQGPLVNLPQFAQTFNCPAGSVMNPGNGCAVW